MGQLVLTLALVTLAALPQDPGEDTKTKFTQALKKLGADEYQDREAASEDLAGLPAEALALVQAELKKDLEPEVRARLERARVQLEAKKTKFAALRRSEAQHAWNVKTTTEAYEKVGQKDPKWDEKVRAALPVLVEVWDGKAASNKARTAYDLLTEAVTAGCNDPLVLYGRARMYDSAVRASKAEAVRLHLEAAQAMKERGSSYHPLRQCFACGRAAEFLTKWKKDLTDDEKKQVQEWLDLGREHLGKAASDPDAPESLLREISVQLMVIGSAVSGDGKAGSDKIFDLLTTARPGSALPLLLKGEFYIKYAWDARGSGWANTVTPDGWQKMAERLSVAEEALNEAWKKNPDDSAAPIAMLQVELGQGKGRPIMETWYQRAMKADPNSYDACSKKMYYLEPKWHGSEEAMLAFGRELVAAGNWEARLPFQLVDAHWALAAYGEKREEHYKDPAVWKDLQSVYEPYLKRHPDSAWDRSFYAKYACYSGRWAEAKLQFDRLGDGVLVGAFTDKAEMERLRAEAAEKGK
jgi:hypothetical protein